MANDAQVLVGRAAAAMLKARGVEVEPGYRHAQLGQFEVTLMCWQSERFVANEIERMAFRIAGPKEWSRDQTHRLEIYYRAGGGKRRRVFLALWSPQRHLVERFNRGPWEAELIALANFVT